MVAREGWGRGGALAGVNLSGAAGDAAGNGALRRTGVHFLFLEYGDFGFQETVFPAEFGDFGRCGEGAGDAVALHNVFETVELFEAGFKVLLQRLVFLMQVSLNVLYPSFKAHQESFDVADCLQQVFAEARKHVRDDSQGYYMTIDQVIALLPIWTAHR